MQAGLEPLNCTPFISAISLKRKLVPSRSLFETSHAVLGAEGSRALVGQLLLLVLINARVRVVGRRAADSLAWMTLVFDDLRRNWTL